MNKKYTKKQITEAIAYWKKQLKAGNCKKLDESLKDCDSLDEVYGELDIIIEQDKALKNKLAKLYRAENPSWKGKWNDDSYVNWRCEFISPMFDRTMMKAIKAGVDRVLSDVKAAVDKELSTSTWDLDEAQNDYTADDVMEKMHDKYIAHSASSKEEFDRFYDELKDWVEEEIQTSDYTLDELADAAKWELERMVSDAEDDDRYDAYLGGDHEDD